MENTNQLSAKEHLSSKKKSVFIFLLFQLFFAFFVTVILYFCSSFIGAYSFLLGSISSILPSFYMALRMFAGTGTKTAKSIVRSFYRGEAGKSIATAIILSLIFVFIHPLAIEFFFFGFGVTILSHWLSPIVIR